MTDGLRSSPRTNSLKTRSLGRPGVKGRTERTTGFEPATLTLAR